MGVAEETSLAFNEVDPRFTSGVPYPLGMMVVAELSTLITTMWESMCLANSAMLGLSSPFSSSSSSDYS